MSTFPATGILPTIDRADVLDRTLRSLQAQDLQPAELIIIDASHDARTRELIDSRLPIFATSGCRLIWQQATISGAAAQRNQGVAAASQPMIWFFDDDVVFEPHCVTRLWAALRSDPTLGGVSAMIINQRYQPPGLVSRLMFRAMAGGKEVSYAGRVLGPAINILPEDRDDLPEVVPVEWLNTTCTLYRREVLPDPPFSSRFSGYSFGEDLALSLLVGSRWKLANARTARIVHDSRPSAHKADTAAHSRMALANRHYIMVDVLGRRSVIDRLKFVLWEFFQIASMAIQHGLTASFWRALSGKVLGLTDLWFPLHRAKTR